MQKDENLSNKTDSPTTERLQISIAKLIPVPTAKPPKTTTKTEERTTRNRFPRRRWNSNSTSVTYLIPPAHKQGMISLLRHRLRLATPFVKQPRQRQQTPSTRGKSRMPSENHSSFPLVPCQWEYGTVVATAVQTRHRRSPKLPTVVGEDARGVLLGSGSIAVPPLSAALLRSPPS
ncbi:unnamed protein product [Calypogeia fissa]